MPQDLPGFYYDAEKNRYFPIKGPIPGSSKKSASAQKQDSQTIQMQAKNLNRMGLKVSTLLRERELYGPAVLVKKRKRSFQEEYTNFQASQPQVWKYQGIEQECDGALGLVHVYIETETGTVGSTILLTGGKNGGVSLLDVGRAGEDISHGEKLTAENVFPDTSNSKTEWAAGLNDAWRLNDTFGFPSCISSINTPRKATWWESYDSLVSETAVITTLGSESIGGQLFFLKFDAQNLIEDITFPIVRHWREITSLNCTIWDSDCNFEQNTSVVGTDLGATVVNLHTKVSSTVCLCKSDVLSVQFIQQGDGVLCGLRNGTIMTLDIRERPRSLPKHNISFPPGPSSTQRRRKRFSLSGNINPTCTAFMPSSVSSLVPLELYDQYFLASSMDGSINLFDHRMIQRGAVQSYEGNVNTHSRIQLGVDPYERCIVSGGEDHKVRLWSIKSGEMLFEEKFSSSTPSSFLSMGSQYMSGTQKSLLGNLGYSGGGSSWGTWVGSSESLFWMQFK